MWAVTAEALGGDKRQREAPGRHVIELRLLRDHEHHFLQLVQIQTIGKMTNKRDQKVLPLTISGAARCSGAAPEGSQGRPSPLAE